MRRDILSIPKGSWIAKAALLVALSFIICSVTANPHANMDIKHNHSQEYFDGKVAESLQKNNTNNKVTYVHLVPHSHDDVGWLKTLYEYFWGIHDDIQRANVHLIIDAAINELIANPERKFTYVEMAFFSRWWELQTDKRKEEIKNLIQEGRLEIINAGWSMNDEACPYYSQIIENMMIGHKFLKEELGVTTNIGWHVDPFGHSSANAALFADTKILLIITFKFS